MNTIHAGILVVVRCYRHAIPLHAQEKLAASQIGSRIDVTVGGKFFTSYRFAADEKYPFFFPVNGPSGASVTSMRNGEYPHHSSLFFGCDKVNGGNYWQEGLDRGRIVSKGPVIEAGFGKPDHHPRHVRLDPPRCGQPLRDTRRIVISAPSPKLRQIDFDITLEALEDVVIHKTNHSLFSARMDPDLTPVFGGTMINADGANGEKGHLRQALAMARVLWCPRWQNHRRPRHPPAPAKPRLSRAVVHARLRVSLAHADVLARQWQGHPHRQGRKTPALLPRAGFLRHCGNGWHRRDLQGILSLETGTARINQPKTHDPHQNRHDRCHVRGLFPRPVPCGDPKHPSA